MTSVEAAGETFVGKIIALVLYSVLSLNLANSKDIIPLNKTNVYAIAWTNLWVLMGFPRTLGHR